VPDTATSYVVTVNTGSGDGTQVTLDIDRNGDGRFDGPGELGRTVSNLPLFAWPYAVAGSLSAGSQVGGDLNAGASALAAASVSPPAATLPALQTAPAVAPAATPMVSASVALAASAGEDDGEVALALDASAVDVALSDLTEETLL
jgi:hypothetical protein